MLGDWLKFLKNDQHSNSGADNFESEFEYCTNCDANLTLQKGYSNDLPYWICKGCGEMLINPGLETDSGIIWRCDGCGALLNIQDGFTEEKGVVRNQCCSCDDYSAGNVNEIKERHSKCKRCRYGEEMLKLATKEDEALEGLNCFIEKELAENVFDYYFQKRPRIIQKANKKIYTWDEIFGTDFEKLSSVMRRLLVSMVEGKAKYNFYDEESRGGFM